MAVLRLLKRSFPEWGKTLTDQERRETEAVYIVELSDIPFPILTEAARRHIRSSVYFPKIAELLKGANAIMDDHRQKERSQLLLTAAKQDEQRCFSPEEAARLLRDLYAKLADQRIEHEQESQQSTAAYAAQQKALARRIKMQAKEREEIPE